MPYYPYSGASYASASPWGMPKNYNIGGQTPTRLPTSYDYGDQPVGDFGLGGPGVQNPNPRIMYGRGTADQPPPGPRNPYARFAASTPVNMGGQMPGTELTNPMSGDFGVGAVPVDKLPPFQNYNSGPHGSGGSTVWGTAWGSNPRPIVNTQYNPGNDPGYLPNAQDNPISVTNQFDNNVTENLMKSLRPPTTDRRTPTHWVNPGFAHIRPQYWR